MKESVRIFRFVVVGTLNALITALVVWLMMHIHDQDYLLANIVAYIVAQIHNFIWCKYWIFPLDADAKRIASGIRCYSLYVHSPWLIVPSFCFFCCWLKFFIVTSIWLSSWGCLSTVPSISCLTAALLFVRGKFLYKSHRHFYNGIAQLLQPDGYLRFSVGCD